MTSSTSKVRRDAPSSGPRTVPIHTHTHEDVGFRFPPIQPGRCCTHTQKAREIGRRTEHGPSRRIQRLVSGRARFSTRLDCSQFRFWLFCVTFWPASVGSRIFHAFWPNTTTHLLHHHHHPYLLTHLPPSSLPPLPRILTFRRKSIRPFDREFHCQTASRFRRTVLHNRVPTQHFFPRKRLSCHGLSLPTQVGTIESRLAEVSILVDPTRRTRSHSQCRAQRKSPRRLSSTALRTSCKSLFGYTAQSLQPFRPN